MFTVGRLQQPIDSLWAFRGLMFKIETEADPCQCHLTFPYPSTQSDGGSSPRPAIVEQLHLDIEGGTYKSPFPDSPHCLTATGSHSPAGGRSGLKLAHHASSRERIGWETLAPQSPSTLPPGLEVALEESLNGVDGNHDGMQDGYGRKVASNTGAVQVRCGLQRT